MDLESALEDLGISSTEAALYLELLRNGALSASELAERTGVTRPTVYAAARSLVETGLIESGAGYGRRFHPVPPERGVATLIDREREALEKRESRSSTLVETLAGIMRENIDAFDGEIAEILSTPRLVTERLGSLAADSREEIDFFVKAPLVSSDDDDPDMIAALERGVRIRSVYESKVLRDRGVEPHLPSWLAAGEEARVFDETLPLKMALFDAEMALLPLETPGRRHGLTSIIIRHQGLGRGLRIMFDAVWERSKEVVLG